MEAQHKRWDGSICLATRAGAVAQTRYEDLLHDANPTIPSEAA